MLKKEYSPFILAVIAVSCFWVTDAVVDYFSSYDEPFLSLLLLNRREIASRLPFSLCFLVFGVLMSRILKRQKRSEIVLQKELDEQKLKEERLYALSVRDELTGLYNRRGFFTLVEQQFRLADRLKRGIFILYADLDNLKAINDNFGHREGDRALVDIAKILRETFRESDIIARIGGDEFVVIPVGILGETIEIINTRINKNIEICNSERNHGRSLSLSFGIVSYNPASPCSIDELLAVGDKLMYEQKKQKLSHRKRYYDSSHSG
ncbi:MAG TPA: GGDEF domain-containing protein [Thermodesulfovibrionales bacterium]|nr:GGDEF domain-containing protein [Thermodesulfovibrionales bacterium]